MSTKRSRAKFSFLTRFQAAQERWFENVLKSFRSLLNDIEFHFDGNDTEYEGIELRGDGDSIIRYLKEAKAYRQHKVYGRVDPAKDGVLSQEWCLISR